MVLCSADFFKTQTDVCMLNGNFFITILQAFNQKLWNFWLLPAQES